MGKGLRIIEAMLPGPVDLSWARGGVSEALVLLASTCCSAPLAEARMPLQGAVEWRCSQCGATVGCRLDFGELDLGIVREEEPYRRNDFAMFAEQWVGLEGGTLDWGIVTGDGRVVEGHDQASLDAFLAAEREARE